MQNDNTLEEEQNVPESFVAEEAANRLIEKPSPKLQAYLEKYQDVDTDTANRLGISGAKKMIDDYNSGALKTNYPNLSDDNIIAAIEKFESGVQHDDKFLSKVLDIPKQVVGGFRDAAQAVMDLGTSIGTYGAGKYLESQGMDKANIDEAKKDVKGLQLPEVGEAKSTVGSLVRGVSQFLAPFGALNKVGKAAGVVGKATSTVGKFAEASAVGAVTDFMAFGEHEKRLSDLIESNPALSNPVSRYLKSDPNDGFAEGRLKNAIEGLGLGAMAEAIFRSVKYIRDTKQVKDSINKLNNNSEYRIKEMTKGYDEIINQLTTIPIRNKQSTTLAKLSESAKDLVMTKEDLLSGKVLEDLDLRSTQPLVIKVTQVQEQAFNMVRDAIPEYRTRIEAGDAKAVDSYWNEMVELHKLDFVAKDIAAKHGGAEAMVFRRHNTAVEQANSMYSIFAKADTLDKQRMVEAHMNILEAKGDVQGFIDGVTMSKGDKIKRVLKSVYMANILSSPVTHWKNTVGTALNSLVMAPSEHAVAAGIGVVRRKIGAELERRAGQKIANGFFSNIEDGVRWKENQILFHSQINSMIDGFKYMGRAIKGQTETALKAKEKGESLSKIKDITDAAKNNRFDTGIQREETTTGFDAISLGIEEEGVLGTAFYHTANLIGKYTKATGTLINTYSNAMEGMYFKAKLEAQTYRLAVKLGYTGDKLDKVWQGLQNIAAYNPEIDSEILGELANIAPSHIKHKVKNGVNSFELKNKIKEDYLYSNDDVIRNLQEDAVKFAKEYNFTRKSGIVANSFQNFRDSLDKTMPLIPGGSIIVPFLKTPANLMKFFMTDRGPLAPLTEAWRADFKAGGARADMAMSKLMTGSALFGVGLYLASNRYVIGDGPKDPAEKSLWRELGVQERSVRINGKFFDIGWADPLASFMIYPANVMEISDYLADDYDEDTKDDLDRYIAGGILGVANTFLGKSYMAGLSDLISAVIDQDEKGFKRLMQNYTASMIVPNAVTFVGKVINPNMQNPDTLLETIKTRIGMDVRPRRNVFGNKIVRNPFVHDITVPITYSNWREDETVSEMIAASAFISMPKRVINNVRINPDQYEQMMMYMEEQDVRGQIGELVKSPIFKDAANTKKSIDDEGYNADTKQSMIRMIYRENVKAAQKKVVDNHPDLQNKILEFKLKSFNKPVTTKGSDRLLKNLGVDVNK